MHPQPPVGTQHIAAPPKHCGQRPCIGHDPLAEPAPEPEPDDDPEPEPPPQLLLLQV